MKAIESLSIMLKAEAIPNSVEYPGYININYLGIDIKLGIDDHDLVIQLDYQGYELQTPRHFTINLVWLNIDSPVLMIVIKQRLIEAYYIIEGFVAQRLKAKKEKSMEPLYAVVHGPGRNKLVGRRLTQEQADRVLTSALVNKRDAVMITEEEAVNILGEVSE